MPFPRIISTVEEQIDEHAPKSKALGTIVNSLFYLVGTNDLLPSWPSKARDKELHRIYMENNHLAGLVSLATSKLVNIPMTFIPRDPTIITHVDAAEDFTQLISLTSGFGKGLRREHRKFIEDTLVLDNGGFLEVLGPGDPVGPLEGMATGLLYRDSLKCERTGDPRFPVIYNRPDGKQVKYHWTRIIDWVQMPTGRENRHEYGKSALSRSFELGQVLKDQIGYKLEKMGSRPTNQVVWGKGISSQEIIKSFMMAEELMDALGLERFAKIVALGGGPDLEINVEDMNRFEPFNEETGTAMAIYALAYIWGLDIRDIWPVTAGASGAEIANMKARGRLPADFTGDMAEQYDAKVAPSYLKTYFDFQDDEEDQMRSVNADIRSRKYERYAKTNTLDGESIRRQMVVEGDLTREEFIRQQLEDGKLEDGTPIGVLFYSQDSIIEPLTTLEGIENPLLFADNDIEAVRRAVQKNRALAMQTMALTRSNSQRDRAIKALAALDWLLSEYESQQMAALRQTAASSEEEGEETEPGEEGQESGDEQDQEQEQVEEQANGQGPTEKTLAAYDEVYGLA